MIFVPIEYLRPNMVLAKDIYLHVSTSYNPPLLTKGQPLTEPYIKKIALYNVTGVYIESAFADDIVAGESLDKKLRERAVSDIKTIFKDFKKNKLSLQHAQMEKMMSLAKDLVFDILSKDEYMVDLIELKSYDDYTYHHSLCVSILAIATGISLGLNKSVLDEIALCALMHDIGKMAVPIEIINKPSSLTPEEYDVIKLHPMNAVNFLKEKHLASNSVIAGIEHHHEKYNGTGYPHGIKGDEIPLYARIISVCDVYDALTSNRPYKKQCFPSEAIEYIMGCADVHFDYDIVTAFLKNIAAYPVGTCVALSNGEIAVVVRNHREAILRPIVRLINSDGLGGEKIDLHADPRFASVTIVDKGHTMRTLDYGKLTSSSPAQKEELVRN